MSKLYYITGLFFISSLLAYDYNVSEYISLSPYSSIIQTGVLSSPIQLLYLASGNPARVPFMEGARIGGSIEYLSQEPVYESSIYSHERSLRIGSVSIMKTWQKFSIGFSRYQRFQISQGDSMDLFSLEGMSRTKVGVHTGIEAIEATLAYTPINRASGSEIFGIGYQVIVNNFNFSHEVDDFESKYLNSDINHKFGFVLTDDGMTIGMTYETSISHEGEKLPRNDSGGWVIGTPRPCFYMPDRASFGLGLQFGDRTNVLFAGFYNFSQNDDYDDSWFDRSGAISYHLSNTSTLFIEINSETKVPPNDYSAFESRLQSYWTRIAYSFELSDFVFGFEVADSHLFSDKSMERTMVRTNISYKVR